MHMFNHRLDTLMGGDFQQYRANVSCGRPDCSYTPTLGKNSNIGTIKYTPIE